MSQRDKDSEAYKKHAAKMAARMRAAVAAASEIGPLPEVFDQERRDSCKGDLRAFCEVYRPEAFNMGWSSDHLKALNRLELTAMEGGLFGLAMPRGSGKTTLSVTAALWALLYGHRSWACVIGATAPKAQGLLRAIKSQLRFNQLLLADFPESCWPIACLEGQAKRALGQKLGGEPTNIEWLSDRVVFPTVKGSPASGATLTVCGITGDIRGQQATLPDGSVIRPDYVLLDDPQTRESARSTTQNDARIETLYGDVLGLAGPGVKISGVMTCTVVQRNDMADVILDREQSPEWHGERSQLLEGWPQRMDLWQKYQDIREAELRNDGDGSEATEFYREHQADMDLGCEATWPERFNEDEASAIQHALNLWLRDEGAFWAEYQNQPLDKVDDELISDTAIMQRVHTETRGNIPVEADRLTAFIDIQKECLFYTVAAWRADHFTGWVVDYGAYPDQGTNNFRYSQAKKTFGKLWPNESLEVHLMRALNDLARELCSKDWRRADGASLSITRVMVDANWGISRDTVYAFAKQSPYRSVIYPSHGKFVGASSEPLNAKWKRKPGTKIGQHWRVVPEANTKRPTMYCLYDTNWWKSFMFQRLGTEPGTQGSLTLFKASPATHKTFARHCKAEYPTKVESKNRTVDEWKLKPDRPDNHWFDCLVGCCVAASIEGCGLGGAGQAARQPAKKKRRREKVSYL